MAKIFKPRRSLRSSVKSGSKRTLVLASGELMMVGRTAIGENSRADLYLGDGVSQMQNLSPAIYGDTSEEDITITDDTSTTASAALGNVTTGKTLGAILGSLKKAISLNAAAITTLNDDFRLISTNHENSSGTYVGWSKDSEISDAIIYKLDFTLSKRSTIFCCFNVRVYNNSILPKDISIRFNSKTADQIGEIRIFEQYTFTSFPVAIPNVSANNYTMYLFDHTKSDNCTIRDTMLMFKK